MPPDTKAPPKPSKAAMVLLREAADQGHEGMAMVADTFFNRSQTRKLPLDAVATQSALNKKGVRVFQYTGAGDPKLEEFFYQQPPMFQRLAEQLIQERMNPKYQPAYPGLENFVTDDLYRRRFDPDVSSWVREYEKVGQIGSHVLLMPPKKKEP